MTYVEWDGPGTEVRIHESLSPSEVDEVRTLEEGYRNVLRSLLASKRSVQVYDAILFLGFGAIAFSYVVKGPIFWAFVFGLPSIYFFIDIWLQRELYQQRVELEHKYFKHSITLFNLTQDQKRFSQTLSS